MVQKKSIKSQGDTVINHELINEIWMLN